MKVLTAVLSLLAAVAGWYYMFYSIAAQKLGGIEEQSINQWRIRLRRIGGFAMFLLAVLMFAGVWSVDERGSPGAYLLIWAGVIALLLLIVILAFFDLRLTAKLRRAGSKKTQ
jgi:hypothetical protein